MINECGKQQLKMANRKWNIEWMGPCCVFDKNIQVCNNAFNTQFYGKLIQKPLK